MSDQIAKVGDFRHPVTHVNQEILSRLVVEDNKVYPLPGGVGRRLTADVDPRLSNLNPSTIAPIKDEVCFFEHIATIRCLMPGGKDLFFVAFRETMDALLYMQQNPELYPEWLMKDPVKRTELGVYIYMVQRHWKQVPVLRSHEDWLAHIDDENLHKTLAYFLLKKGVITQDMYGKL